jgi:hypothetical protein
MPVQGPDLMAYGLTANNELVAFNANNPKMFTSKTAVTGVVSGEKLMSIDFRPATGELYALSMQVNLHHQHFQCFCKSGKYNSIFTCCFRNYCFY